MVNKLIEKPNSFNTNIDISVIVPTYNDISRLLICIEKLKKQRTVDFSYEIIVIDNGSSDQTVEVLQKMDGIVLCQAHIPGSYAARNEGLKVAQGRAVAFTDSDCCPEEDWLLNFWQMFLSSGENIILSGQVKFFSDQKNPAEETALLFENSFSMSQKDNAKNNHGVTANLFCDMKTIVDAGGFNTELKSGGDFDFCRRAVSSGAKIIYVDNAIVYHPARTIKELIKKRKRVIGGSWDRSNKNILFTIMLLIKRATFLLGKRTIYTFFSSNYKLTERLRLSSFLFLIYFTSIFEIIMLAGGKKSNRS